MDGGVGTCTCRPNTYTQRKDQETKKSAHSLTEDLRALGRQVGVVDGGDHGDGAGAARIVVAEEEGQLLQLVGAHTRLVAEHLVGW